MRSEELFRLLSFLQTVQDLWTKEYPEVSAWMPIFVQLGWVDAEFFPDKKKMKKGELMPFSARWGGVKITEAGYEILNSLSTAMAESCL